MVQEIGRRTALNMFPSLPTANWRTETYFYPTVFRSYHLSILNKSDKDQEKTTAECLSILLARMGIKELVFLGDTSKPWLFREGPFSKVVKSARRYLVSLGMSHSYTGGFKVTLDSLPDFLPKIYVLTRANAISFDVHFVDINEKIVCHPCKYFNLHFTTRTGKVDKQFKAALDHSGLHLIDRC
jgi:hypothetical protein